MPDAYAVAPLEQYGQNMRSCGWKGGQSFLVPEIKPAGDVEQARGDRAMASRAMTARLQKYAQSAGLAERKFTMHSCRVGAAVTRTIAGQDMATIMASIGWKSKNMAQRYIGSAVAPDGGRGKALVGAGTAYVDANGFAASLRAAEFGFFRDS